MAEIIPFRGTLYNVSKVSIEDVLAPPYDIITPEYREELYRKSSYNIVRIDFGKDEPEDNETNNRYTRAKRYLEKWIEEGILVSSEKPSLYPYEISYSIDGGGKRLLGFLGLVKIEELGKGKIYPHECTYCKPKKDRLTLLRFCQANTSPIFALYKSSDRKVSTLLSGIAKEKPYIEAKDTSGAIHRLWQIDEEKKLRIIKKELEDKAIFIADGHHRYESALEFQKEMSKKKTTFTAKKPFDYVLMFLTNMLDDGVTILPTHRLVKDRVDIAKLSEYFKIEPVEANFGIAKKISGKRGVFGLFLGGKVWYTLEYKGGNLSDIHPDLRQIDVLILHDLIFKKILSVVDIDYEMDIRKAIEKVRSGAFSAAFFLNPTKVEDVEKAAIFSIRLPPKSTYFYPKPLTGMVINRWESYGV